ncbi:MAG: FKBP-type peptidyl-prolyl cis-trans isomerase, partial [Acidimicrobiales bacterium]
MFRRTLPAILAAALLFAACGASEKTTDTDTANPKSCPRSDAVDAVAVTGAKGEQPRVTFDKPFKVTTTSCKVVAAGKGAKVRNGATAIFDYVFLNGRDGKEITSSYGKEPAQIVYDDKLMAGVHRALDGVTAGSKVLVAISPADGFGKQGDPTNGVRATDTILFLLDLHEVRTPLARAKGTAVDPVAGLPTVVLAKDGAPTISVPATDPPAALVAQELIAGKGALVKTGQTIAVHYTGVLWTTGAVFDSSWKSGKPASFPIGTGGVIPGWDKGLVGQRVGSQMLLVIPPADGYPQGSG